MANYINKKTFGIPLSLITGVLALFALGVFFNFMTPKTAAIYCIVLDVITVLSFGYIAFSKRINIEGIPKYAAITLTCIQLLFTFNFLSQNYWGYSIIGQLNWGSYPFALIYILCMIAMWLLLYPLKVWKPTIVFCILQYIPEIVLDGYVFPGLAKGNEIIANNPDYWEEYSKWINMLDTWQTINVVIAILAFAFVLIWIFKKEKSPSAKTNPLNII